MTRGRWVWAVGWALVIEALLLWPSPPSLPPSFSFAGVDKLVHAGLFAMQAVLVSVAVGAWPRRRWLVLAGVIAFGACTEWQQHFIPSRSMELADFLADAAGAAVGLVVFALWAPKRQELHR